MSNKEQYKTSDLIIASFLKAKFNLPLIDTEIEDGSRVFFVFKVDKDIDIQKIIYDYFNGEDLCSIRIFTREVAGLRSIIKNMQKNQ